MHGDDGVARAEEFVEESLVYAVLDALVDVPLPRRDGLLGVRHKGLPVDDVRVAPNGHQSRNRTITGAPSSRLQDHPVPDPTRRTRDANPNYFVTHVVQCVRSAGFLFCRKIGLCPAPPPPLSLPEKTFGPVSSKVLRVRVNTVVGREEG